MPSSVAASAFDALRPDIEAGCRDTFGVPDAVIASAEPIPGGHSGFTYRVRVTGTGLDRRLVVRLPPPGAQPRGPADVVRQGRIMDALHAAGVPVPAVPVIAAADTTASGRPYIAMDEVPGFDVGEAVSRSSSAAVLDATARALRSLQRVPLEGMPLTEAPVGLDAELARWQWLMERAPADLLERSRALHARLDGSRPVEAPPVLVHGDFHYGNLVFDDSGVAAIVDWEIAQVGQPLVDWACLAVFALRRRFPGDPNPAGAVEVEIDQVRELSGASPAEFQYHLSVACFKYAAILGYNLRLHETGKRPDPIYPALTTTIYGLIDAGLELVA